MRLIDADALSDKYCVVVRKTADEKLTTEVAVLLKDIEEQTTIDAEMIKHGSWTEEYDETQPVFFKRLFRCSACGRTNAYGESAFCPCCGADMRGEEEHETEAR